MEIPDISQIAEYAKVAQNVVVSLCALSTAAIAFAGFNKWRKELKGKSEYQLAKDILKSVYKVKRGFSVVRNPMMFAYEYPQEIRDKPGHPQGADRHEAIAHAYEKRWEHLENAFRELEDLTLDAMVEWGSEYSEVIKPLRKCRGELLVAIQGYVRSLKEPPRPPTEKEVEEEFSRSTLYEVGSDSKHDSFTPEIDKAIAKFEVKLRPHIG